MGLEFPRSRRDQAAVGRQSNGPHGLAGHGIVIGVRRHGETSVILDLLTRERGRHLGDRARRPLAADAALSAARQQRRGDAGASRIEEQLGHLRGRAALQRAARDHGDRRWRCMPLNHLCALVRLLPEREPHPALHDRLEAMLDRLDDRRRSRRRLMVRFELLMLTRTRLRTRSRPLRRDRRSARTSSTCRRNPGARCSRAAGAPYRDRLLAAAGFPAASRTRPPGRRGRFRLAEHLLCGIPVD